MTKEVKNVAASVRARLLKLSRERGENFDLVLTKYALERMLYRISQSPYKDILILKGALLFELLTEQRYRPTRDADFLSQGDSDDHMATSTGKQCDRLRRTAQISPSAKFNRSVRNNRRASA